MLAAVLVAGMFLLSSCIRFGGGSSGDSGGSGWAPPYCDPSGFEYDNGRFSYTADGKTASKTGVDVSDHQGYIDWDAVSADGIEFALLRVGYRGSSEGGLFQDDYFEYNLQFAHAAGIECGVYFFSQAISEEEGREEAEFVLSLLRGVNLEYPVVFDYEQNAAGIESRTEGIGQEEATAIARAFCETIEDAGYRAMIYGNGYDLGVFDMNALEDYALWYAEYGGYPSSRRPIAIWQYRSDGHVAGIETVVDLNLDIGSAS